MTGWVDAKKELPKVNQRAYVLDFSGRVFEAVYLGPVVGWVNVKDACATSITHWAKAM